MSSARPVVIYILSKGDYSMKTSFRYSGHLIALVVMFALVLAACGSQSTSSSGSTPVTVHLGYFPNMTHAVALVGVAQGTFQKALGSNVKLDTKTFNAGPAEIEALFAGDIDIGFVGPSPAINGYIKSNGQALRIIAGASSGGVLFVVRPGANINSPQDLAGKKLADPQVGGTQDVALRYYLQQHGLKPADKGGNVQIISTDNASILSLFKQGKIDGAWMPEPWATRMIVEGQGKVFLDERSLWPNGQFTTTNIIVRTAFMNQHPDLVNKFLQADIQTVQYIQNNQQSALNLVNSQLQQITGKGIASNELTLAFSHLIVTYDPLTSTIATQANRAYTLGYLGSSNPNLSGLYNLGPLNQVLTSKGLATVAGP
jgi:NitT/TauT family transport system substrate-binding protein